MISKWTLPLIVLLFIGSTAWNVGTRISTQTKTVDSLDSVVRAIEISCFEEEALREQYKVRAEDEIILADATLLQTHAAITAIEEAQIPAGRQLVDEFQETIPDLEEILATITILPVPDCEARGDLLRKNLPEGAP